MGVLNELKRLSAAEEFFQYLGVAYEPRVLNVARLHILKKMGQYIAQEDAAKSDDALRQSCKAALETAYATFAASSPIEERVFKVHKDAVAQPAEQPKSRVTLEPLKKV